MNSGFYVYLHINSKTGEPFYVGKGKNNRAFETQKRSNWWSNFVNKNGFDVIILEDSLLEKKALEREVYWIKRIGRKNLNEGPLINLTNGGEGTSGRILTNEQRKKMSEINIGNKNCLGRKLSDETKTKMSLSAINKKHNWANNHPVNAYNEIGELVFTFKSETEAAKFFNKTRCAVNNNTNNLSKFVLTSYGKLKFKKI